MTYLSKQMDKSEEKLWDELQRSSLSLDTHLLTERNISDNGIAKILEQSSKLSLLEENDDDDAYIFWLTKEHTEVLEPLNGIKIKIIDSNDTLIDLLIELESSNVFLIINHALVSDILSVLDDFSQIVFIYVLTNEQNNDTLVTTDSKRSIRQVCNNVEELFRLIIDDIDRCTKDLICTTIFDSTTIEESSNQTKNISVIWHYLLIESLFDLTVYNNNAKTDFIEYCRQQNLDNSTVQKDISKFENEYTSENAVYWYTIESFVYRQLNKAFRTRNIDGIFKLRFFITDFQKQLEQCYNEETHEVNQTVYRGQLMSQLELIKLKKSLGKYISFNTYLSASFDEEVALMYGSHERSVLFEIEVSFPVNMKNKRARPVNVQYISRFSEESEVIFPIGSTFLVDKIWMKNQKQYIRLKLIDDDEFNNIMDLIQTMYMKQVPSKVKFANLLVSLGDYEKAERYIKMLIEDLESSSDNINIGYAYYIMGEILYEKCDYPCALSYFEKALDNIQSENIYRSIIYRKMGYTYRDKNEYDIAIKYLNQSLEYKQNMDPLELADLYEAFGNVYREMEAFDRAIIYVNLALDIRQLNSSASCTYGSTYTSLALIHEAKSDYTKALELFQTALDILSKIIPKSHPNIMLLYAFIGNMHFRQQDMSLAMTYSQKAFDLMKIAEQNKNLNPMTHIFICNVLIELYSSNEDVTNALCNVEEALNIYNQFKNTMPETYRTIRKLYINSGVVYHSLYDFDSALKYTLKALPFATNVDNKMLILFNIGRIYLDKDDTEMALQYFNDSLKLNSERNEPSVDNDTLFSVYFHMSNLYKCEHNLEKSIFFVNEALGLQSDQANKNPNLMGLCYVQLAHLCPEQWKKYTDKIIEILQKNDLPISTKIACHTIIGDYYKKQNQFSDALLHFELSVKYQLTRIPPCYKELISMYSNMSQVYKLMEGEDSDKVWYFLEKSADIYLNLSNMKEIPIKDKKSLLSIEGYIIENINQSSLLTDKILWIYRSIANYSVKKENYKNALNYLKKIEQILNEYNGKKKLLMQNKIYILVGWIYQKMQYYNMAIVYYHKSLRYISNDYNEYGYTFFIIAEAYHEKEDYLMAISKCKISLTFLHNSQSIDHVKLARCYAHAAVCYKELKNDDCVFIYAKQALKYFLLCNPIHYDSIISSYVNCVDSLKSARPWDYKDQLNDLLEANKLSQYYLEDSSFRTLYYYLGHFYYLNGKYDNALLYYNKSLEYTTELDHSISVYNQQWEIYIHVGQLDQAYDAVKKIIVNQFNLETINFSAISDSYMQMGMVYHRLGKYKSALKCYQSVIYILKKYQNNKMHKNYMHIYNYIGNVELENGRVAEALKLCTKARDLYFSIKNDKISPITMYITLALIECKRENYYDALDYLGKAWEDIFNRDIHFHLLHRILYNHIGYVYFKLGQTQIAMNNYLKVLSLYGDYENHPDLAQVYKNIGLIYEQENNYPVALSSYELALEAVPNKKNPHFIQYENMINTLKLKSK